MNVNISSSTRTDNRILGNSDLWSRYLEERFDLVFKQLEYAILKVKQLKMIKQ